MTGRKLLREKWKSLMLHLPESQTLLMHYARVNARPLKNLKKANNMIKFQISKDQPSDIVLSCATKNRLIR